MKKTISLILACMLLVGCVLSLASCSAFLVGTYENKGLLTTTTVEFKLDGTVIYSIGSISLVGEYELDKNDKGEPVIELDFEDDSVADLIDGEFSFAKGKENGTAYIEIAGVRYNKVK